MESERPIGDSPPFHFPTRLELLLEEKLSLINKVGAASKGFAATQMRTDAYRQVGSTGAWTHLGR